MKLRIGEYEVDIKVKHSKYGDKANKADTMNFLNDLVCICSEAHEYNRRIGCPLCVDTSKEYHDDIYNYLKAKGAYDIKVN